MPRFDSQCQTCGLVSEAELAFGTRPAHLTCPRGHREVRKRFSPPAIVSKGSGGYVTDHRKPAAHRDPAD
jgi:predicted nucleic acid-binding Zn ribbon protein